ncbi:MAG: S24 family peptidase [Cyanobacteria bacterium P01_E01_bin.6]
MGFPIPGDAIEQSLNLNQLVIKNSAATFFMRVDGIHQTGADVNPGDVLAVDRSLDATDNALVVAAVNGELAVMRVQQVKHQIRPIVEHGSTQESQFEVWGVVTTIIRSMSPS